MVRTLVAIYLGSPQLGDTIKTNYKCLGCLSRNMLSFDFLEKVLGQASPYLFYDFFEKNVSHAIFYKLRKYHCLFAFTS